MSKGYENTIKKMTELSKGREFIIWGTNVLAKYMYEDMKSLGYTVKYFVDDEAEMKYFEDKEVKNSIELFYENRDEIFIITIMFVGHGSIYDNLLGMGFRYNQDFVLLNEAGYFQELDMIDSLLAYSRFYNNIPGFKFEGAIEGDTYKILVLGGSTSDPTMGNNKSWTRYLYEKLTQSGYHVVIINGAIAGYGSGQEFFKLVRDGIGLQPDMCITFDGFNDVGFATCDREYPTLHVHGKKVWDKIVSKGDFAPDSMGMRNMEQVTHGLKQQLADWEIYISYIRKIHAISQEFGIEYIGFFQPMIRTGKAIIDKRLEEFIQVRKKVDKYGVLEKQRTFYENVRPWLEQTDYMYDLTATFDDKESVYYDSCHATDEGNEIIANAIFDVIVKKMEEH